MHEYVSFSDESSSSGHDFMVIGGVLCRDDCASQIISKLDVVHKNRPSNWFYEWKSIRHGNIERYKRFVDLFFEYNREHCIDFSCVVIECADLDHATFNEGDGEKGFNKFLFQHLFRHYRAMRGRSHFRCYHDRRISVYDLADIREMLNWKCFQSDGKFVKRYRELAYSDKIQHPMLQFADVLIGAVASDWNQKVSNKTPVARHICAHAGLPSLAQPTPASERHFDIWRMDLKKLTP